jgi:hypothetical protein
MFINSSLKLSSAEVGSSRSIIFGFLSIILAIANLCFCHQDNLIHLSQISVSSHFLNSYINSHFDSFMHLFISSSLGFVFSAYVRFSRIVQSKTEGS